MNDPPIRYMPADGFVTRLWNSGDGPRARVRIVAWRNYANGVQWAFQYFPMTDADARIQLQRLARFLAETTMDDDDE